MTNLCLLHVNKKYSSEKWLFYKQKYTGGIVLHFFANLFNIWFIDDNWILLTAFALKFPSWYVILVEAYEENLTSHRCVVERAVLFS